MLPDGELKVVELSTTRPTNEPFEPATQEQVIETLKASSLAKFKFKQEKFCVYAYDCSDGFFAHAHSILESMRKGVADGLIKLGMKVSRPEVPMIVMIMPSREAYDAIRKMPPEVLAYYNTMTNRVVMYEDQELCDAAPEFALKQASYVVAHEGVHQLLANVGIQKRLSHWPAWITEGIAEYYCPLKVSSSILHNTNADLPVRTLTWTKAGMVNDLRMWSLLQMRAGTGASLETMVRANQLAANGYALAWGAVHYLATKKSKAFRDYMADVSKYEPLEPAFEDVAGKPDPLFVKHFGSDFTGLEKEIQQYLNSKSMQSEYVDPVANQTHYIVKSVEKVGRAFAIQVVVTTSPDAAKKWKEKEEKTNKNAHFFTIVCKTRGEAERQLAKLQQK